MANTETNPFAYNPAASADLFGPRPVPVQAPSEEDISQYMPQPQQGPASSYGEAFQTAESQYGLPEGLLSTIGYNESRYNPNAVSPAGATGLMQLMPPTAKEYGVDARDPYASIDAAGKKMAGLVKYYNGDMAKAVAAYNYGEGNLNRAIRKAGDNWLSATPRETQLYVSNILGGAPPPEQEGPTGDTYDIPLSNGDILHAPIGVSKEDALAYARSKGIDAVGLRDILLANGDTLHAPENLTDEEAIKQVSALHPDMDFTLPKKETEGRGVGKVVEDIGVGAMKGGVGLGQSFIGLADLLTPGDLGGAVEDAGLDLNKVQEYLSTQYSPQQQEAIKNLAAAHGWKAILQAAKDNPSALVSALGESAPQMVGGAGIAKAGLMGLGKVLTKVPAVAPYFAAGIGEAGVGAGAQKENLRVTNPEGEATGANTQAALITGLGTGIVGAAGAKLTTALGGIDPTLLLSGNARKMALQEFGDVANTPGFFRSTIVSMIGEGVFQEAPQSAIEQMSQNFATDKPLFEGVEDESVKGALMGALMGGGANAASQLVGTTEQAPPPPPAPVNPPAGEIPVPPQGEVPAPPVNPLTITPEERARVAEAAAGGPPVVAGAEEVVAGVPAEQVVAGVPAEQVVAGAPAAEVVAVEEPILRGEKEKPVRTEPTWLTDILGLKDSSGVYKKIATQGLDLANPADHEAIQNILIPIIAKSKTIKAGGIEALTQQMEAIQQGQTTPTLGETTDAQQIPSTSPINGDGSTQSQESQAAEDITQAGKGMESEGQGIETIETGAQEEVAPTVSSVMVKAADSVLQDYKEKPIPRNIGHLRTIAKTLELPVTVDTPHAEVYDLVARAIAPAKDIGRGIQINANEQGIDSVINKAAKKDEAVDEGLQARWIQHAKEGTLHKAEDDVTDFHYDLKTSNPDAHAKAEQANTRAIKAVEDTKTIAAEEREATADKLERENKATNLETIKKAVEAKQTEGVTTAPITEAAITATIQEANLNPEDDNYLSEQGDDFSGYESLSDQEVVVAKALDRTIKKEKAEELKVFDVPEKRVQLLAARKKAHALLDTGKITPDEFIRRSEQITDEERVRLAESKYKRNPRARGANYLREKLLNALRKGDVSQEEHDFAEWFIKKNPDALDNLGISIKEAPEGSRAAGQYTPLNQVITLFKGQEKNTTAVHEMLHHLERAMPEHLQKGIRKAWLKQTIAAKEKAIKNKAAKPILDFYTAVLSGDPKAAREALNNVKKDKLDMYHHLNPSEFWAVNATDVMHGKYGADAHFIAKLKQWLKEAYEHIKHTLGLNSKAPILKAINHVLTSIDTDYTSKKMLAENIKGTLYNAPPSSPTKDAQDIGNELVDLNLVKTSDKSVNEAIHEGVEAIKEHSNIARIRASWIDETAGVSKALSSLDMFDKKGKMRGDFVLQAIGNINNVLRSSKGYIKLAGDGTLMSVDDPKLNLRANINLIDGLGYKDNRKTFFTALRVVAGEEILRIDVERRADAKLYKEFADILQKDIDNLTGALVDARRALTTAVTAKDAAQIKHYRNAVSVVTKEKTALTTRATKLKEASSKLYAKHGRKSAVDMQADIDAKVTKAEKKEALAATTTDKAKRDSLLDQAEKLRNDADRSTKTLEAGVGTEQRVTPKDIALTKELLAKDPRIGDIMNNIFTRLRKDVDLFEEAGIIDAATANDWRSNPAYIPLYKSIEDLSDDPSKYVEVLSLGAKHSWEVKSREGSKQTVNVAENLVKHSAFMAGAAAQNVARQTAAMQLHEVNSDLFYETSDRSDPQATKFKVNGEDVYYHIGDALAFEAFQTMLPLQPGWFRKAAKVHTKMFRAVTLINPLYWYRQLLRDPMMASLVTQAGLITPFQALYHMGKIIIRRSEGYNELQRRGITGVVDSLTDTKQIVKGIATKRGVKKWIVDFLMHMHESTDAGTRVAVYERSLKTALKRGIVDPQQQKNFAAMQAKEVINFSKKGNAKAHAAMRDSVPFFASTLNGMDTLARASMPGSYGNLNAKDARIVRKHFYANAALITTASILYALQMDDDEDYRKSTDWLTSWLIPTGNKDSPFIKYAIPFEAGFCFKVIPEILVRICRGSLTPKEGMEALWKAGKTLMVPPIMPQIVKPIGEVIMNHDLYTGHSINSFTESRLPLNQRTAHATPLAEKIAGGLPSFLNMSPNDIEHLGKGWFTEAWALSALLADAYISSATGVSAPTKELGEMFLVKGAVTAPDTDANLSKFYEMSKLAEQLVNGIRAYKQVGDKEEAKALRGEPENAKLRKMVPLLGATGEQIGVLQKRIARIKNKPDAEMSPDEKAKSIREIKQRINILADRAVERADKKGVER